VTSRGATTDTNSNITAKGAKIQSITVARLPNILFKSHRKNLIMQIPLSSIIVINGPIGSRSNNQAKDQHQRLHEPAAPGYIIPIQTQCFKKLWFVCDCNGLALDVCRRLDHDCV